MTISGTYFLGGAAAFLERLPSPFCAIKLVIGDLGTDAGTKTDAHARVRDADGRVIKGLSAAGKDMASNMGGNYPGAGITAWTGTDLRLYRRKAHGGHVILELSIPTSGEQTD